MRSDRRTFLAGCAALASSPILLLRAQQNPLPSGRSPQGPPAGTPGQIGQPGQPPGSFPSDVPTTETDSPGPVVNRRAILDQDQKDLQHDCATLAQMANDLKTQADSLDTTKVLSMDLVHKAEAIEKLAHHIKTLAQGT